MNPRIGVNLRWGDAELYKDLKDIKRIELAKAQFGLEGIWKILDLLGSNGIKLGG